MHSVPTIETERLILRPYRRDDFGPYSTLFADPEVTRFIGGVPFSREQAWTRFLRQVGMWHYFGFGFFALQDRETGHFIGEAGFHDLHRVITPSLEGTMETGWALSPARTAAALPLKPSVLRCAGATSNSRRCGKPASSTSPTLPRCALRRNCTSRKRGGRSITGRRWS